MFAVSFDIVYVIETVDGTGCQRKGKEHYDCRFGVSSLNNVITEKQRSEHKGILCPLQWPYQLKDSPQLISIISLHLHIFVIENDCQF